MYNYEPDINNYVDLVNIIGGRESAFDDLKKSKKIGMYRTSYYDENDST